MLCTSWTELDHEWKNGFFVNCLTPILEAINVVEPPSYERILELDKAARDFAVPSLLDDKTSNSEMPRFLIMQRALVTKGREIGEWECFARMLDLNFKQPYFNCIVDILPRQ